MPMIEEENSTNARNSIPHYGEYKEFKPKGLEKGFFYPWIGKNYEEGIKGNKILVVGVQHWCDPDFWKCNEKHPRFCLTNNDDKCPVWNIEEYKKQNLHVWDFHDVNKGKIEREKYRIPTCPLYASCSYGDECQRKNIRYLHCETCIAVNDYINNKEIAKRARIFSRISNVLQTLSNDTLEEKKTNIKNTTPGQLKCKQKEYLWNRIIFTNYIQHYTKFYDHGDLDEKELDIYPRNNNIIIKTCVELFCPDLIIVMFESSILEKIKNIEYKKYIHIENKSKEKEYYILVRKGTPYYNNIEKDIDKEINEFINNKLEQWGDDIKINQIEALAIFLCDKFRKAKKSHIYEWEKKIVEALSKENIKQKYTKDGKFNVQKFKDFRKNHGIDYKNINSEYIKEEMDNIKRSYKDIRFTDCK